MTRPILSFVLMIVFVCGCTTVPVTGRRQLTLLPNSQILPMSYDQYGQVLKENGTKLNTNKEWAAMVKKVGSRVQVAVEEYMKNIRASGQLQGYAWEYNLIDENVVNAWCMPGGKVVFYSGIMPICKDEKGVAVVMGHEIAHAIANHGRERMSKGLVANGLLQGGQIAVGQNPTMVNQLLLQAAGLGTQLGMLKFSRIHESEADRMGLIFMAMAGYDPNEAPVFWQRMDAQSSGERPPEFLSTHPHPSTRIADLKKLIPEAMRYYKAQ